MFTPEEKDKALKLYEKDKPVRAVIQRLGYPTRQTLIEIGGRRNRLYKLSNLHVEKNLLKAQMQMEIDILNEAIKIIKKTEASTRSSKTWKRQRWLTLCGININYRNF